MALRSSSYERAVAIARILSRTILERSRETARKHSISISARLMAAALAHSTEIPQASAASKTD
jgi:BioD-like phosphotransacetylase family protein